MKMRTMLGLTLVGTALYAHKQHGGDFSLDSMKKSLKDLWAGIQNKAVQARDKAEELAVKVEDKVKSKQASSVASTSDLDDTGLGSSGYRPGNRH